MVLKNNATRLVTILILLISCSSNKGTLSYGQEKQKAIENILKDYFYSNKKDIRKYDVFILSERGGIDESFYYFVILPQINFYHLRKGDTIGSHPKNFPTNYRIYKDKLFLWNDKLKPINQETLNVMDAYNVLDSIALRYELGIYDDWDLENKYPDIPVFNIKEFLKGVDYIVCKKKINLYEKVKSSSHIEKEQLPKPKCE